MDLKYEYVAITWLDAVKRPEVEPGEDLSPVRSLTVGLLVEQTDTYYAIAHTADHDFDLDVADGYRDVMTIPSGMIESVISLTPTLVVESGRVIDDLTVATDELSAEEADRNGSELWALVDALPDREPVN